MNSAEARARAAADVCVHTGVGKCCHNCAEVWAAGAAAEREAVMAVVRGHRCKRQTPDSGGFAIPEKFAIEEGHRCAEAILRELEGMVKPK